MQNRSEVLEAIEQVIVNLLPKNSPSRASKGDMLKANALRQEVTSLFTQIEAENSNEAANPEQLLNRTCFDVYVHLNSKGLSHLETEIYKKNAAKLYKPDEDVNANYPKKLKRDLANARDEILANAFKARQPHKKIIGLDFEGGFNDKDSELKETIRNLIAACLKLSPQGTLDNAIKDAMKREANQFVANLKNFLLWRADLDELFAPNLARMRAEINRIHTYENAKQLRVGLQSIANISNILTYDLKTFLYFPGTMEEPTEEYLAELISEHTAGTVAELARQELAIRSTRINLLTASLSATDPQSEKTKNIQFAELPELNKKSESLTLQAHVIRAIINHINESKTSLTFASFLRLFTSYESKANHYLALMRSAKTALSIHTIVFALLDSPEDNMLKEAIYKRIGVKNIEAAIAEISQRITMCIADLKTAQKPFPDKHDINECIALILDKFGKNEKVDIRDIEQLIHPSAPTLSSN